MKKKSKKEKSLKIRKEKKKRMILNSYIALFAYSLYKFGT